MMRIRQPFLFGMILVAAMILGGIVHRYLRVPRDVAPESAQSGPSASEEPAIAEPKDASAPFSLVHWLAEVEADPITAVPGLTSALAELDADAALPALAEQWTGLKRDQPWSLAERIVHDGIFFRWAELDSPGLLAFINKGPAHRSGHSSAVASAIVRWASRDPHKAFEVARASHDQDGAREGVLLTVELLGRQCASALADHLGSVSDIQDYKNADAIVHMLAEWSKESPRDTWAWIRSLRRKKLRDSLERTFLYRWAEDDPEAAAAAVLEERPTQGRTLRMVSVAGAWAKHDPKAAKAWAEQTGNRAVLENLVFEGLYEAANEDPLSIDAGIIATLPRGEQRMAYLRNLVNQASKRDLGKTLALIDSLPEEDRTVLRLKLASKLFDNEEAPYTPQEALDFLAEMPVGIERARSTIKLARNLAERDPAALVAWMADNPESFDQERMLQAAAEPWVSNDLEGAQAALLELPDSPASRKLASEVAKKLLETDPQALLDLAAQLPQEVLAASLYDSHDLHLASQNPQAFLQEAAKRDVLPNKIAIDAGLVGWAQEDVHAAVAWARQQGDRLPTDAMETLTRKLAFTDLESAKVVADAVAKDPSLAGDARSVVVSLTNGWTRKEPEAAGDWASSITDSKLRNEAVSVVSSEWSRMDWPAARDWIEALPEGSLRDNAVRGARWPLIQSNPRLLLEALPLVSSEEIRQDLRSRLFSHWKNQDAAAARAAAEEVGLPEEEMTKFFGDAP